MPVLPAFRRHTIYQGPPAERMSCIVGDLDNDGVSEFIVSTRHPDQLHWFGRTSSGAWQPHLIDDTFPSISVGGALGRPHRQWPARPDRRHQRWAAGVVRLESGRQDAVLGPVADDFDGDGRPEIALCEVALDIGRTYGRLALFRPGTDVENLWEAEVLHDRLLDAHSLQVADFDGDGRSDLYVGEMGRADWTVPHPPAQRLFLSRGVRMEELVIDSGVGTHEAQAIELDGRFGIVSKPYRALQDSAPRPKGVDALSLYLPE